MKLAILHTQEALDPPVDPVIAQLEDALLEAGHVPRCIVIDRTVAPVIEALSADPPELVVNIAESFGGKSAMESNVAALLNLLGLRYTGSSPAGLLLAGDKSLTKKVLSFHGIRSPEFATVYRGALDWAGDIAFPLIVKPPQEDASLGITRASVVHDLRALLEQIDALQQQYQQPVLVEEFVDGREFYVGVLGNANARALPVVELDFSAFPPDRPRIASWEAKWGDAGDESGVEYAGTRSVFPDDLPPELTARLQEVAVDAYQALRLRDYGRIDLRVTANGDVYVIEVNPNCYLERSGEFARAAERDGLSHPALVGRIVELAAARYSR
ncbi:MAG TPA: ATP-grasp domain-containing protein [Gemmatimonadaceae bacterium]|nr:ATP-grasp domain-containing protein [Gemmatimonadaceae bacterium]